MDKERVFWGEALSLRSYGLAKPMIDLRAAFEVTVLPLMVVVLLAAALAAAVICFVPVTLYGLLCLAFQPLRLAWYVFVGPFEGAGVDD